MVAVAVAADMEGEGWGGGGGGGHVSAPAHAFSVAPVAPAYHANVMHAVHRRPHVSFNRPAPIKP